MSTYIIYLSSWLKSKKNNVIDGLLLFLFRYCELEVQFLQCVASRPFYTHLPFLKVAPYFAPDLLYLWVQKK